LDAADLFGEPLVFSRLLNDEEHETIAINSSQRIAPDPASLGKLHSLEQTNTAVGFQYPSMIPV